MPTLYDKYGGMPTMKIIVREFYKYARTNSKVGHYFSGLDMEKLIDHQVQFLSFVLGKPVRQYVGNELAIAHHPLHISDADFDEICRLLGKTLVTGGVESNDIELIMDVVFEIRDEIVDRHAVLAASSPAPLSILKQSSAAETDGPLSLPSAAGRPDEPTHASNQGDLTAQLPTQSSAQRQPAPGYRHNKRIFKPIFGGLPKIKMIVRDLYSQVNQEPDLRHYFLNVSPEKIISDQEYFSGFVLREADHFYMGSILQSADPKIQVGAGVFNEIVDCLKEILRNAGLPEKDVPRLSTHIMEIIEETRTQSNDNKIGDLKPVDVTAETIRLIYQRNKLDAILKSPQLVYTSSSALNGKFPFPFYTQLDPENQTLTLIAQAEAHENTPIAEMNYLVNEAKQIAPILTFEADMEEIHPLFIGSYTLSYAFGVPHRLLIKIAQKFSKTFSDTLACDTEKILLKTSH